MNKQLPALQAAKIKNLVIADMQNIMSRKQGIVNSTLGLLSSFITEGAGGNLSYVGAAPMEKVWKFNLLIAGTPRHFELLLLNSQYNDFLNRIVFISLERDRSEIDIKKKFDFDHTLVRKIDAAGRKRIANYEYMKFDDLNPRHNIYMNNIAKHLIMMGHDGHKFIEDNNIYVFNIPEGVSGANAMKYLHVAKPSKIEKKEDKIITEMRKVIV